MSARPASAAIVTAGTEITEGLRLDTNETLAQVVVRLAREIDVRIAVAESCTGGLLGAALTSVAGSSAVFRGGVIAYADEVKTGLLGVGSDLLAEHGAVSGEVVEAMARGALSVTDADVAVAVTGIAGPDGGSPDKPVGLVWFGVAVRDGGSVRTESVRRILPGDREGIRTRATIAALDLLRTKLLSREA